MKNALGLLRCESPDVLDDGDDEEAADYDNGEGVGSVDDDGRDDDDDDDDDEDNDDDDDD